MKQLLRVALGLAMVSIGLNGRTVFATTYTNTIAQMTDYITSQMAVNNIPGLSIALVDDQTVVWSAGFGYADREAGVAADADTVFHVGSCSKAILGTAYMQLLDQGRVNLEAPLTNYMAEFSMLPRFTNSEPVTIRNLLNHHSGLPGDFFNGMGTESPYYNLTEWLIQCLQNDYPFAPVNERNYYCNNGFVLLSDVVRRITGTNFSEATDAMLFVPLGMEASSFLPDKAAISNRLAAAYSTDGERHPTEFMNCLGSGSMYSSANDLTRYIQMILANGRFNGQTLVSSNAIDVMTEAQGTNLPLNVSGSYSGLGWDDVNDYRLRYAGKVSWKDGATYMHSAFLAVSRDLKLGVAVIQNTAGSQCDTIGIQALQWAVLDKTGAHWPTNTFVPVPSPVTNRPQTELDALVGLYVGDSGYHKVVAETGTLTFIKDAYSDASTSYSNLVPRANGWFSLTNSQDVQFAFINLSGHDMVVVHQGSGAFEAVSPFGERYVPSALSAVWNSRTNRVYRMVDIYPTDYFWDPDSPQIKTLRFWTKDNALLTTWMFGTFVEEPQNDNLAFQRGVQYRKGGAIRVTTTNGFEMLHYSSFRFLDEAAIPTLNVPAITNGAVPFDNGTQWYWFTGQTGKTYRASVSMPNQGERFVRVTDRNGITQAATTNALLVWTCSSSATYALAVSATNVFSFTLSLTDCGLPATGDIDGDRLADLISVVDTNWYVWFSTSGYQVRCGPYNLGVSGTPATGDIDGDRLADLISVVDSKWYVWFSTSGYQVRGGPYDLGLAGLPATGDIDGDGLADLISVVGSNWYVRFSTSQYSVRYGPYDLGISGMPATGDIDGDRLADLIMVVGSNWNVWFSTSGYQVRGGPYDLGVSGLPAAGDIDGDRLADLISVVGSNWYVRFSTSQYSVRCGPYTLSAP